MTTPVYPIMIVDDIKTNLLFLKAKLKKMGIENTITCQDSRQVISVIEKYNIELILLDLKMPHIDGESLLATINQKYPELPVIIVTDVNEVKIAVKCIREGALDYVTKPVDEDLLFTSIQRALTFRRLQRENLELKQYLPSMKDLDTPRAFSKIITRNKKMVKIFNYIEMIAKTSQPILITGETGVGKELVAQSIHSVSALKGALVPVNIAGLEENIVSDALFGHVKGAYTGADANRPGLIEQARDGTLFLDEIGDLSLTSQVKLLRLLQEGEYLPIGSDKVKHTNARIIVATNKDIRKLQKQGKFREDLIFRLRTHHIHVPNLSERMDDLPLLMNHFLNAVSQELGRDIPKIAKDVFQFIETYSFPGNIRELRAMVYDAVSRSTSDALAIDNFKDFCSPDHFKSGILNSRMPVALKVKADEQARGGIDMNTTAGQIMFPSQLPTIKEVTACLIEEAIARTGGNQTDAAKMLGISQPALNKRLKKMKNDQG